MNFKRAIGGFLLSFVFLFVFIYAISGVQYIFGIYPPSQSKNEFSASVSNGVQDVAPDIAPAKSAESSIQPVPAAGPELEADTKSAISIESNLQAGDKILFEKDSNTPLPIASLTKLMTAVIVLDNYNLRDMITVHEDAGAQSPMKQDVQLNQSFPVESFLDIMLVESSNKSAYALSTLIGEQKFVGLMNQKAKELGLENTFFSDPTGLSPQDVSTAHDLANLAEYILKNYPKIADISRLEELDVPGFGTVINTDELLGETPEAVCSKTGFTAAAEGCLLLVINNPKNNDYLINVILGAADRFSEMKKLINYSSVVCK